MEPGSTHMDFAVDLTNPTLIERFEPYFRHREPDRHALKSGDRAVACKNAKAALAALGFARDFGDDPELYDQQLCDAVTRFQEQTGHRNIDGVIGPGTRSQLVSRILQKFGAAKFASLDASDAVRIPTVFLSYAWTETRRVDKLDQWLRDHGVRVIRDVNSFKAGSQITENIWNAVLAADKVIVVYSEKSKDRDWPSFEREVAERVEALIRVPVLVYLRLDDAPLKAHDPHRIAIDAQGKTLRHVGAEILRCLEIHEEHVRYEYDENAPL